MRYPFSIFDRYYDHQIELPLYAVQGSNDLHPRPRLRRDTDTSDCFIICLLLNTACSLRKNFQLLYTKLEHMSLLAVF